MVAADGNVKPVMVSVTENLCLPLRTRPLTSSQAIMLVKLNFHPRKIQITQDLDDSKFELGKAHEEVMWLRFRPATLLGNIIFNGALFYMVRCFDNPNFHDEDVHNPRQMHEEPLHKPKVSVWCPFSASCIKEPYFSDYQRDQTITVNSEGYAYMINDFLDW